MLAENTSGGHGEGIAGEGAAGFNPAGGEALERVDCRRYANVRRSSGQRVAVEVKEVDADANQNGQKDEQDYGATQPHTDTRHDLKTSENFLVCTRVEWLCYRFFRGSR